MLYPNGLVLLHPGFCASSCRYVAKLLSGSDGGDCQSLWSGWQRAVSVSFLCVCEMLLASVGACLRVLLPRWLYYIHTLCGTSCAVKLPCMHAQCAGLWRQTTTRCSLAGVALSCGWYGSLVFAATALVLRLDDAFFKIVWQCALYYRQAAHSVVLLTSTVWCPLLAQFGY
jgi:hypothetical protein